MTFLFSKGPVNNVFFSPRILVKLSNLIALLYAECDNTKELQISHVVNVHSNSQKHHQLVLKLGVNGKINN